MSMSILGLINNQVQRNTPAAMPQQQTVIPPQLKNLINVIKFSKNRQLALQSLMNQNPQIQQIYNLMQSSGNPEQLFYSLAQQYGVDPNPIIQELQAL